MGGVRLDSEGHVRGDHTLVGVGMLGSVAKEAMHFVHRVEGGRGLKGGEVTSGCKHEGIDGSGAAEEGADDGLEEPAVGGGGEGVESAGAICGAVEPKTGGAWIMGESHRRSLTDSGTADLRSLETRPSRERRVTRDCRSQSTSKPRHRVPIGEEVTL